MKIAIQVSCSNCLDSEFLKQLKAYGFDGVDFIFGKDFFEIPDKDKAIDHICCNLEDTGLTCAQVHLPYYSMLTSSESYDEEMEANITDSIRYMSKLGAAWGAFHPMSAVNFNYDTEKALQDNVHRIQNHLKTAEKYNVGIAIENLPFFYDTPNNRFYCSKAEEVCELIDHLNHPLIGACWDFGHINLIGCDQFGNTIASGYDTKKALESMENRIKIIHVHDNYGDYDWHHCPTIGTVNWYELLPVLFQRDFSGYFSLECELKLPKIDMIQPYLKFCAKTSKALLEEIQMLKVTKERT